MPAYVPANSRNRNKHEDNAKIHIEKLKQNSIHWCDEKKNKHKDTLHQVGREARDFVAHTLGRNDGHLLRDLLVHLEVQRQFGVVPVRINHNQIPKSHLYV